MVFYGNFLGNSFGLDQVYSQIARRVPLQRRTRTTVEYVDGVLRNMWLTICMRMQ